MAREDIRQDARRVLEDAWQPKRGYCFPNSDTYPHLWLWDSCFHSIAWAALKDSRAVTELRACLSHQFASGFVPHMVYARPTIRRGPRSDVSSFTQPPVYCLAASRVISAGLQLDRDTLESMRIGLRYLMDSRRRDGLAYVLHPWETGCDDSPRWDSWVGKSDWNSDVWFAHDMDVMTHTTFSPDEGEAISNDNFASFPSLFNAILSHGLIVAGELLEDSRLRRASFELGEAMEGLLWDEGQGMFVDRTLVGGGDSVRIPTLDGVLSAVGSVNRRHALTCLDQLRDPAGFAAPHGIRYLRRDDPRYRPDQYWRGPAWPQLTFLAVEACRRWGQDGLAEDLGDHGRLEIANMGWSEYWNPETGEGLGARPQTWSALAGAL